MHLPQISKQSGKTLCSLAFFAILTFSSAAVIGYSPDHQETLSVWNELTSSNRAFLESSTYSQRFSAPDPFNIAMFGWTVDFDGNYMVVGSPGWRPAAGVEPGAVYVYFFDGTSWN